MKYLMSVLFMSTVLFTSCNNKAETDSTQMTPTTVVPFTVVGSQMRSQQPASTDQSIAGTNPAHGQPGHLCELPVGAPLNVPATPIKASAAAVTTNEVENAESQNPTATIITPEGMNPPHGQKNHRCDMAVGAPLPKQ